MKTIFEHAGVMLAVDYTPGDDGIHSFNEVRVLDGDYRPTGPNLTSLLDTAFVLTGRQGDHFSAESFLSAIVTEIDEAHAG